MCMHITLGTRVSVADTAALTGEASVVAFWHLAATSRNSRHAHRYTLWSARGDNDHQCIAPAVARHLGDGVT